MNFLLSRRAALKRLTWAFATALAGCGTPPPKKPPLPTPRPPPAAPPPQQTTLSVSLMAQANVNPDLRGRPSPVTVRVYTLKQRTAFESADFFALYERDSQTLGADIVERNEFQMMPGDSQQIDKQLASEVTFVGVFAAFRDLERARWRATIAVIPRFKNNLRIRLEGTNIAIERMN